MISITFIIHWYLNIELNLLNWGKFLFGHNFNLLDLAWIWKCPGRTKVEHAEQNCAYCQKSSSGLVWPNGTLGQVPVPPPPFTVVWYKKAVCHAFKPSTKYLKSCLAKLYNEELDSFPLCLAQVAANCFLRVTEQWIVNVKKWSKLKGLWSVMKNFNSKTTLNSVLLLTKKGTMTTFSE